jgi:HD superfamily phosphohydrolase
MLKLILEQEHILDSDKNYQLTEFIDTQAYNFICGLIHPSSCPVAIKKNFIYQIVSNTLNDLDVDKLDYLCRDSYYLCCGKPFNVLEIIQNAKVIDSSIAFPEKVSYEIFKVYRSRYDLHKQFYNHKTVISIETMLKNILNKLDSILNISANIKLSNIDFFTDLTDSTILNTTLVIKKLNLIKSEEANQDIEYVNKILDLINKRKLYKCVYYTSFSVSDSIDVNSLVDKILLSNTNLKRDDLITSIVKIGLIGGEKTHPFDNLYFYSKSNSDNSRVLTKNEISYLISGSFQEKLFFIINTF